MKLELEKLYEDRAQRLARAYIRKRPFVAKLFDSIDDASQHLCLCLWRALANFDKTKGTFGTFSFAVFDFAVSAQIQYLKAKKRCLCCSVSIQQQVFEGVTLEEYLPSEKDVFRDVADKLESSALKPLLNKEAYYFFILEMPLGEISASLHRSKRSIIKRIKANIKKLRNCMEVYNAE